MGKTRNNSTTGKVASSVNSFPPNLLSSPDDRKTHGKQLLRLETLLTDRIWVVHDFFTLDECKAWIHYMEHDITMELTQQRGNRFYAQRDCHRFQRTDATMAQRLFQRIQHNETLLAALSQTFKRPPIMCNPNVRLYKYTAGMSFGKHVDESFEIKGVGRTRVTVLIYLSSCQGGETSFEQNVSFSPRAGAMLLHVHGDECLEHEGKPVIAGIKYILRTDLVYAFDMTTTV